MAIKYESTLKWGDIFYLKNDPEQLEHCLVGIILLPGKPKFELSHQGAVCEVYECETTREPDMKKRLSIDNPEIDEDEE